MAKQQAKQQAAQALENFCDDAASFRRARQGVLTELQQLDSSLTAQFVGVNVTKTVSAAFAVATVPLMFLFPPAGVACGIVSGATGVGAALGDFIADRINSSHFKSAMERDERHRKKFEESTTRLAETLAGLGASEDGMLEEVWSYLQSVGSALYGSYGVFNTAMNLVNIVQLTKAVQATSGVAGATIRLGTGLGATAKGFGIGTGGLRAVTVSMEGGAAGSEALVSVVASTGAKAMAGLAAVVSVADMIHSWSTRSATAEGVKECIKIVKQGISELRQISQK